MALDDALIELQKFIAASPVDQEVFGKTSAYYGQCIDFYQMESDEEYVPI